MREVARLVGDGDEAAAEALDVYCYRIRKYVGAYAAALGRFDALIFTAGIGENNDAVRAGVCQGLEGLGIRLDARRNKGRSAKPRTISADDSQVAVLVVPTNEELEIAQQTLAVVTGQARPASLEAAEP
jgi:acetate kinase